MAIRGVDFKWYDGFFLSMLATSVCAREIAVPTSVNMWWASKPGGNSEDKGRAKRNGFSIEPAQEMIIVSINWKRYHLCMHPLHIWIVVTTRSSCNFNGISMVDYTTVFIFRLLMFLDNGLASGMGLDLGWQQRYARFCGRIVVLSVLVLLLYPFLWVWTIIGTLWFTSARSCLPEEGKKWGFLIWLLFSYCGLVCIACMAGGKWLTRRHAHLQRAQQGIPISEYGVLVDMIRVPDWAFEAAGQEMRGIGQDTAYHPGLYLTPTQREAVEALIQELPKFRLKAVPTDCSECPICLEEFHVGNEVRGLPCAHNFHVDCIDQWLRLNVKCPRCRCSVFPNLDLSALNGLQSEPPEPPLRGLPVSDLTTTTSTVVTSSDVSRYVRSVGPAAQSQSYLLRLQGLLCPVRVEGAGVGPAVLENDGSQALVLEAVPLPQHHNVVIDPQLLPDR